ncbi:MAG TPA: amidohydrolase [Ohtaekwangia sp.]|nr:amidohydrolase [Ohtaekwangia sp.]
MVACSENQAPADLIITGGPIYTVNDQQPVVEGVAVRGGKIIFAGSAEETQALRGDNTKIIDLNGRGMTPGFIEGHGHLMEVGYNELQLDLMAVKSYDELVEKVKDAVSKSQPGEWIVGRGWHQDKWDNSPRKMIKGFQTHHLLSAVSPDNPVFLEHASGHAALANAKAMEIAGVNQLSAENLQSALEDEGGEIIRDGVGNPTGIFNEQAMGLISRFIPQNTPSRQKKALELALAACARNGITGFHDAGAGQRSIDLFKEFKKEGRLTARLYVMLAGAGLARKWFASGPEIDPDHFLTIRSIKLSCDGALGSRGAWLLEPYADRPGFTGMTTLPMDTVLAISREALKHGFQVCSHAIGDRANREILDRYQRALGDYPQVKDHRFRIEHAQHLHPADIPRFAELGVIPAMQAIHMSSDRPWAIDRLGEKRIREGAYVWQSLLRTGARIVNGTDAPVEPLSPVACFYASITRKTLNGIPEGGFEPEQKMTREQALRSYTLDAAFGGFQENVLGSIEVGKYADFTVFSRDIMKVPEADILDTRVEMTIVNGVVAYSK